MNYTKLPPQVRCNYCYNIQDEGQDNCTRCGKEYLTEAEKNLARWRDEAEVYAIQKALENTNGFVSGK